MPSSIMTEYEILQKKFKSIRMIAIQSVVSIFLFGYIAYHGSQNDRPLSNNAMELKIMLLLLSIAFLFGLQVIKETLRKKKPASEKTMTQTEIFTRQIFISTLIGLMAAETPALFGVVASVNSKNFNDFYLFALISFAALIFHWPRYEVWEEELKKYLNQGR